MPVIKSKSIVYNKFGDPRQCLELTTLDVSTDPKEGEVFVQWLAAPVNPLDINRVQGNYAMKEQLPSIGGSEGAGRIIKYGIAPEEEVCKLDNRIPLDLAATFQINPPTAWLMLKKYVDLEKGDYVIQNAANSGVGRGVIQLCKAWGFKSINIVRNRKDIGLLKTELWNIGADHVFTEEEFEQQGRKFIKSLPSQPKLALNGVGGKSVLRISAALERGGTCVTYGGMSKQAHQFPTSALVFNDIRVRGVAIGLWVREGNQDEFLECLNDLQKLAVEGKITAPPMDRVLLEDFKTAINRSMDGGHPKQLLILNQDQAKI